MKSATVRARVEPGLKIEVESVLSDLGLSVSEAIELFMHQIKLTHSIPFKISIPNDATKSVFAKTDHGKELNYYDSPEDMFKKLDK